MLTVNDVIELRRELHRNPERSGLEANTADRIVRFFRRLRPDSVIQGLGGHGAAFVFSGPEPGPTILLRCELDALPIEETNTFAYKSAINGTSHKCGHDGHMAILAAVGLQLSRQRPVHGRVVLLYQPAEENGQGAAAVIEDAAFEAIKPDRVFALHNLPGFPLGDIMVRTGTFSCASRGMIVRLHGTTAHAAQPETGISPAAAMCRIIGELNRVAQLFQDSGELAFATVVGARLGEKAFGTAPGYAEVMATLRSETDKTMDRIVRHVETVAARTASAENLRFDIAYEDVFTATVNAAPAVDLIKQAAGERGIIEVDGPFRWSEDFGRFTARFPGALFALGSGKSVPDLHNPDYDFPDDLIESGADIFLRIIRAYLGSCEEEKGGHHEKDLQRAHLDDRGQCPERS